MSIVVSLLIVLCSSYIIQEATMSTTKPRKKKVSDDEIVSSRDIKLSRQVEDYNVSSNSMMHSYGYWN